MESLSRDRLLRAEHGAASPDLSGLDDPPYLETEAANDCLLSQLARTIEYEIIPRLMMAHRAGAATMDRPDAVAPSFTTAEIVGFAELVMAPDEDGAMDAVDRLLARRVPVDRIYIELLAPAARHLGVLWEEDICSFTDVTIGLGRLQRVLRELSPGLGRTPSPDGRRILLLPCPGEQHTFGLLMVGEFFRRAGWDVSSGAGARGGRDAASQVGQEAFDVIGFSMGAEVHLAALATTIAAVRHASCNPGLVVLVGGPLFDGRPDLVDTLGADGMTIDGREAPSLAARLVTAAAKAHPNQG